MLVADHFQSKMPLRQPGFPYSAFGSFTKVRKFKETEDTIYIYQDELDKACFKHVMAYDAYKDLPKRITFEEKLSDKAFEITSNSKYDDYQHGIASAVCNFIDKKIWRYCSYRNRNLQCSLRPNL